MSKAKYGYGWLLKWILAAILLAVGLSMYFTQELVFLVTGVILVIFSLFRVYFLLKTLKKEVARTLNLIEIIFGTLLGIIMIYVGIDSLKNGFNQTGFWSFVYKYGLVFVLSFRAIVFFYSTTFLGEKTEQPKFWFHLVLFSIGSMIAVLKDFNESWVATLLLFISIIGSIYLGYDGLGGYKKYREYSLSINEEKDKQKNKDIRELPNKDIDIIDKNDDERPYVS